MPNSIKKRKKDRKIYTYTLVLDELSIICAFFSAIVIRYNAIVNWVDMSTGIYVSMIVTVLLFAIIVFYFYDFKYRNIVRMDPVDNLFAVCKNRLFLSFLTITYFYITQRSVLASRIVMGLFLALSALYGFAFRMIFRMYCKSKFGNCEGNNIYQLQLPVQDLDIVITGIKKEDYDGVLIRPGSADDSYVRSVLDQLEKNNIRAYIALKCLDHEVGFGIVSNVDSYAALPAYIRDNRFNLFGVRYCIAKPEEAVHHVIEHLAELKGKYVCFSNVHTSVMAKEHPDYAGVLNDAALVFPDGAPVAELQRKNGYPDAERVAGPDFMENMFCNTMDGRVSHYFYGSTEETLSALRTKLNEKYPGLCIKGMYSPPFKPLTPEEDREDVDRINGSGADIIWIGLGAPKQEKWMNAHKDRINGVMMGVGAGFDFHAGTIQRAPVWIQRIGFEWLYRLFKDPRRLFKRYIVTNIKFIYYVFIKK